MLTIEIRLTPGVSVFAGQPTSSGSVALRTAGSSGGYDLGHVPQTLLSWVEQLAGGRPAQSITDDLPDGLWPHAYALLERLNGVGALSSTVRDQPDSTAADSAAPPTRSVTVTPDRYATRPVWSPGEFAAGDLRPSARLLLRFEGGAWIAEQPAGGVSVQFDDAATVRLLTDCSELGLADLDEFASAVMAMLVDNALLVRPVGDAESADARDAMWEFHDYYFHLRSRPGRHTSPSGGSYRFLGEHEPPPVLKPPMSTERIALAEAPELTMPYGQVRARRRSIRHNTGPLTVADLGAFLSTVARLRGYADSTHDGVSRRSYPGGGARYELEIYPLVHDVAGLAAGAYHYDPGDHALERLSDDTPAVRATLAFAGRVATRKSPPQVLFVITARFGRVAWKYESIAYSLVLKNVGALYAVMYDTATAMGLSPCALGAGNIDYHALATHTDPLAEPSVGEFVLGGPPLD